MSDLSRYLKVEFYRAFTSKNFALTICLTFLLYLGSTLKEIFLLGRDAAATVPYFFGVVNNFNSLMDILLVISAIVVYTHKLAIGIFAGVLLSMIVFFAKAS